MGNRLTFSPAFDNVGVLIHSVAIHFRVTIGLVLAEEKMRLCYLLQKQSNISPISILSFYFRRMR